MADEEQDVWGKDGILSFPINCDDVLAQLGQDMRDDWFFDTILYKDLFAGKHDLKTLISELLLEGNGRYSASSRQICDIPKKGLGIRYSLETDFYDRFIYQAICSFLIKHYDPLLSHRALGHRYNRESKDNRYLFKNRIDLWKTFEGVTFTAFKDKKVLLTTDLINYFENITIESIRVAFESKLDKVKGNGKERFQIRNAIDTLCDLLTRWSFSDRHGLPQNRDASSFIANVVLSEVDRKMVDLGYDYYRYVDDIRIICDNPQQARKALHQLIAELRTVGMNINSAKTRILSAEDIPETIAEFFPNNDDRTSAIDMMWKSRSRRVIARSVPLIHQILKTCIEQGETQSRQFRFSVNRLTMLIDADLFDVGSALSADLVQLLLNTLQEQAASTDQYCKLLSMFELSPQALTSIENYLSDEEQSIYQWQNYHLWFVLARKKYKTDNLINTAKRKMESNILSNETPAIFIYLYCVDETDLLRPYIEKLKPTWPYMHQRYFLFATKNFSPEELKPLYAVLGTKVKGTVRRAAQHFAPDGQPLGRRERSSVSHIYQHISPYD
ncbi:RNA-directed DNA polymerase [Duganella callida]|uniref:RNA-directed DNA polymerase n=1 Tax=Duganella callida TaxID=2561932 RepID=A0A4Y9SAZ0_9BURK|nr:RNA-directed DNA polymerase [Duganella callida]TFW18865.1 RNA-directed DNA polymerase [Duganella callida]